MRRLSRLLHRDEHGATMVFVAVTIAILFGFTALGVDLSHMTHERGRIQHAADSAAFAVAYDCVSSDRQGLCDPTAGQPTVNEFVDANSAGDEGAITNALSPDAGEVVVEVDQNVNHYFAPVIGISDSDVHARAKVVWEYAIAGKTLPYAVSICHWMNTAYDTPVLLDGTVNEKSGDINKWKGINEAGFDALPPETWKYCDDGVNPPPEGVTVPDGARTIRDGLWFSEENCSNNISSGGSELELNEVVCGTNMTTNPAWKYKIGNGDTILLAVYAPHVNWEYGGFCANETGEIAKCPEFSFTPSGGGQSPMFEMEVVGFVPFEVMGCRYGQPAYTCGGEDPAEQGLYGKFVTTTEGIPGTEYGPGGTNFGAVKVRLDE